jgi:hypothetical protein
VVIPDLFPVVDGARLISMSGACKDCTHWDFSPAGPNDALPLFGVCEHPKLVLSYHVTQEELSLDSLTVYAAEDRGVLTGPDFGCIHYTAKSS